MRAASAVTFLRGGTTPAHVTAACMLGGMIGLVPAGSPAAGMLLLLGAAALLVNVNLVLLLGIAATAQLLAAQPLMDVSFAAGRVLLDGPTRPLFAAAINAPVLAWFGLDCYVATGGAVLGAALGGAGGLAAGRIARRFRRRLEDTPEGSSLHDQFLSRPASRAVALGIFTLSPRGQGWKQTMLRAPTGWLRRRAWAVLLSASALAVAGLGLAGETRTRFAAERVLERTFWRGVSVADASWLPESGSLALRDVRIADANDTARDILRSAELTAHGIRLDFWRGRVSVDRIEIRDATLWLPRDVAQNPPLDGAPRASPRSGLPGERRLSEVFAEPEPWCGLAAAVSDAVGWLGRAAPPGQAAGRSDRAGLNSWLRRERNRRGLMNVVASHLCRGKAQLEVGLVTAGVVGAPKWGGFTGTLQLENPSSHPWLNESAVQALVGSADGSTRAEFTGPSGSRTTARLRVVIGPLATDAVMAALRLPPPYLAGGTLAGELAADVPVDPTPLVNAPLMVVRASGCRLDPGDGKPGEADPFTLRVVVHGPLANPWLSISGGEWERALIAAGEPDLAARLRARARTSP